ncbi:acyl-CoA-like ligand-binding transcription factor [Streptomyces litchfieldiae]|uniref:TetR family transcriptional regulator n=1 Tax=Streptomyces litchfieldiae TaxID=3075543 RepID=A0ABU2MMK7_9ACTN|nr:TetR family transcriptional regulator [Streptomyces sp. DSM 44938]MDT0342359.1 TetR family transcriptional regulator [Streptomyces sp. DSM 44938]
MSRPPAEPTARTGLRELKKQRTRRAIRRAAYRLFGEQGYDATRVDQIAEAAEVSTSTVFRYFPTKEDIVLTDEDDPVLEAALRARPAGEPPLTALREALRETVRTVYASPEWVAEVEQRMRLVRSVPAVRARLDESMAATGDLLAEVLAARTGRSPDELELRVFIGATLGALREVLMHWVARGLRDDLMSLLDRAMDVLEHDLAD